MIVKDIRIDTAFNILTTNGDFLVNDSDEDHVNLILNSYLGAYKEYPLVGLGIINYQSSSTNPQIIIRDMTVQLNADGYQVNKITNQPDFKFFIDALRIK